MLHLKNQTMKCETSGYDASQRDQKVLSPVGFADILAAFPGFCSVAVPVFRNGFFVPTPAAVPPLPV
ncbi:hypothetical protein [Hymenobacter properus]|uniref:Uncharacterized protein n=1 Tax=Hymenobacter properus TaxID=2791026 RepID=A0A931BKD1_9BACT|nr:hypothetical protein [Hymenobacter properus]MBF9141858.1 hypothetical protein [Hymenobacter properus]MBR7720666.1 hypothetical protein [Microvirga sp. SRT04]